jgi:hypothetical protein
VRDFSQPYYDLRNSPKDPINLINSITKQRLRLRLRFRAIKPNKPNNPSNSTNSTNPINPINPKHA